MRLIFITVTIMLSVAAKGQTIDYDMLEKYSHREAQEAVITKQVALLKLNAGQITFVKQWSFYYADKAIAALKAHNGSSYSLYKKLKPLQTEI
jgi:NACalpha-BTF3-like transcription factor